MKRSKTSNAEFGLSHKRATLEHLERAASLKTPTELFANLSDDEEFEEPKMPSEKEDRIVHIYYYENTSADFKNVPDELKTIFETDGM